MTTSYCSIPAPSLAYAIPSTKEEFDRIPLNEQLHDWVRCGLTTFLKNDGQEWERLCYSKTLGDFGAEGITVIFQWFDYRPTGSEG